MPYQRSKTSPFVIDRRFGGVGRIRLPSGTTDEKTFRRIDAMCVELYNRGRIDLLRAIKQFGSSRGRSGLAPMVVFAAFCNEGLSALPSPEGLAPLVQSMLDFIDSHDCSIVHKQTMRSCVRHIARVGNSHSPISDLPEIVGQLRIGMRDKPAMFNRLRATALAFTRARFKKHHPLWNDIAGVDPLAIKNRRPHYPKSPDELKTITARMDPAYSEMAWSMASTGMGPKEYIEGKWEIQGDRVAIHGTKREGRERFVPLIKGVPLVRPTGNLKAFRLALGSADFGRMGVYDLRRSYATWLEACGVPRTRMRMYMGHGARDVTDVYLWQEVKQFIADDSLRLSRYVNPEANVVHEPTKLRFELIS